MYSVLQLVSSQTLYYPEKSSGMDRRFHSRLLQEQQGQRAVWICTVCNMPIHKNIISVQCSNCEGWCHMRRCSGIVNHKARTANFIAQCCSQAAQICQNDNTSPPSTPGATSNTQQQFMMSESHQQQSVSTSHNQHPILTLCQQLAAVLS